MDDIRYKIRRFWFDFKTNGLARQSLTNLGWMCSFFVLFNFPMTFLTTLLIAVAITYIMREIL